MSSRDEGWLRLPAGESEVALALPAVGLRPGTYRCKISVSLGSMHDILDAVEDLRIVVRDGGRADNCTFFQAREWQSTGASVCAPPDALEEPDPAAADEG
jgi:hypothetical protein